MTKPSNKFVALVKEIIQPDKADNDKEGSLLNKTTDGIGLLIAKGKFELEKAKECIVFVKTRQDVQLCEQMKSVLPDEAK